MVRRRMLRVVVVAGLAFAGAAGCAQRDAGSTTPTGGAGPGASAPPVTTSSVPVEPAKLAAAGLGPYVIQASLDKLKASGVIANVTESAGCPGWATADATGALFGTVSIVFYNGTISWITVTSRQVSTVEGATLGMSLDVVKGIYGGDGVALSDGIGGTAVGVPDPSGNGLLFRADKTGHVTAMEAGRYETLEFRFTEGEGC